MDLSRVLIALCVNLACNHFLWLVLLTYPTVSTSSFEDEYQIQQFADMADRQKNFVIDTWRIPKCWMNPSMTIDPDDHSKVVLIWRMPDKGKRDKVGYLWLNRTTMEPTKNKDMIEITNPGKWRTPLVAEDARIFVSNNKLHVIYNTHLTRYKRLFFAPVQYTKENDIFFALDPPNHVIFNKEVNKRHQKNWSPFDFCPRCDFMDGMAINATSINEEDKGLDRKSFSPHLLMVYSLNPHRIVQTYPCDDCLQRNGTSPVSDYNAEVVFSSKLLPEYEWKWGEMRGGTPALKFGDKYLAFFHSSGKLSHPSVLTYVMGAYMFESQPPFAITHMSAEPIVSHSFINESFGWAYKSVDYIVFPMGFLFDDNCIYVSYGKNDRDGWILKLNRSEFVRSLKPVKSKVLGMSDWDKESGTIIRNSFKESNDL